MKELSSITPKKAGKMLDGYLRLAHQENGGDPHALAAAICATLKACPGKHVDMPSDNRRRQPRDPHAALCFRMGRESIEWAPYRFEDGTANLFQQQWRPVNDERVIDEIAGGIVWLRKRNREARKDDA